MTQATEDRRWVLELRGRFVPRNGDGGLLNARLFTFEELQEYVKEVRAESKDVSWIEVDPDGWNDAHGYVNTEGTRS